MSSRWTTHPAGEFARLLCRDARNRAELPEALRKPNVLSAIFRVGPYSQRTGSPSEYALRLLVEPAQQAAPSVTPDTTPWTGERTRTA